MENMEIGRNNQEKKDINNKKVKRPKKYKDLKWNVDVDEQQDDIKHLKERLKEKALCVTCNPSIATTKIAWKNVSKKLRKAKCKSKERK